MGIRFTELDKKIFDFINEYGFITISQCAGCFFKNHKKAYEEARIKLNRLFIYNYLAREKYHLTGEYVFKLADNKNISDHRMVLLNFYSAICNIADEINYFKIEENWKESKRKSDGHIIFTMNKGKDNEYIKAFCVEIEIFYKLDIKKYDEIYENNEIQKWYEKMFGAEWFPDVIIISPSEKKPPVPKYNYKVISLDYKFTGLLNKVVLPSVE